MAVVAIEGFDLYNGTGNPTGLTASTPYGWVGVNWFYGPGITTGRFGGQCYYWNNEGSESGLVLPTIGPQFTVACAARFSNVPALNAATNPRSALRLTSGGFANSMLGWRPNPDGSISVWRLTSSTAGTLLGTSAAGVILSNVWHFIEMSGTFNTATGAVTLKVDGVAVITLSGVNTCGVGASTSCDGCVIGSAGLIQGNLAYIDDMYFLDTNVSLGERRIEVIRPNADTATAQWTPNSGTVHYNRVNATLAQNSTYNSANVVGNLDLYDNVDLTGIPVNIDYVQITCFAQKSDAGARSIGLVADLSGTQLQSPDKSLTASLVKYAFGMATKPGGGAWDASSVNSLKIGPKVTV
jgi:hypothetical protein